MRQIGSLPGEAQARLFADFLHARGIRSEMEAEADRTWSVWILDDDHLAEAQSCLTRYQANPDAPEFQTATDDAAKARKAEAEDLAKFRNRIRTRRSVFPKFGGYGIGWLTFTLMLVCFYVAVASLLGDDHEWLRRLYISDPENPTHKILPEVFRGEIWRLITPIFMHASLKKDPLHLIFNMLWFYQLGSMIEARKSSLYLFFFIVVSASLSNLAQYFWAGPAFVGMSGVVYALAGYVWICGKYNRASGLYLDPQSVTMLLIWMVVCFTGILGPIANAAHLGGLIVGMAWGGIAAFFGVRKPE
jgi:GlpG protein